MSGYTHYAKDYFEWLKGQYIYREIESGTIEVVTPYLDSDNDGIVLYIEDLGHGKIRLTDDGWTIYQLNTNDAHFIDNEELDVRVLSSAPEIIQDNNEIAITTNVCDFPVAQQKMITTILEIETMRRLRQRTTI